MYIQVSLQNVATEDTETTEEREKQAAAILKKSFSESSVRSVAKSEF
jgi:hypothetical protein